MIVFYQVIRLHMLNETTVGGFVGSSYSIRASICVRQPRPIEDAVKSLLPMVVMRVFCKVG